MSESSSISSSAVFPASLQVEPAYTTVDAGNRPGIEELLAACDRFVPRALVKLMGGSTIADIHLGQHVEKLIHILFADIRGYSAMAEKQDPSAILKFINDYLHVMEPVAERNGGIIEKFIGDAIMTLFVGDADDAVNCAVELATTLDKYNVARRATGQDAIRIGIGINSGLAAIGATGTPRRLQTPLSVTRSTSPRAWSRRRDSMTPRS